MSTAPARRRTRVVGVAVAALTGGLALQPMLATPAQAGVMCDNPIPILGTFIDDCVAPEAALVSQPSRRTVNRTAVFELTTAEPDPDDPNVTFECRLERGLTSFEVVTDWTDCSVTDEADGSGSLGRVTYPDLEPGDYRFSARATDAASPYIPPELAALGLKDEPNKGADQILHHWKILDTTTDNGLPPRTTITKAPKRWHLQQYAGISYVTDEEVVEYQCRLNGEALDKHCDIGQAELYGMSVGDYTFEVSAVDVAGETDATPARTRWTFPLSAYKMRGLKKGWKKKAGDGHFLRSYAVAKKRGTTFRKRIEDARSVVLVVTKCPGCGKLKVAYEGKPFTKINLNAKKTKKRRVVTVASWRKPHSGSFKFEVVTKGKNVIVEGVGVSAWR